MTEPLLRVTGLVKRFGGLIATNNLSLDVRPGELHARDRSERRRQDHADRADLPASCAQDAGTIHFAGEEISRLGAPARVARGLARTVPDHAIAERLLPRSTTSRSPSRRGSGHSFRFLVGRARRIERLREPAAAYLDRVGLRRPRRCRRSANCRMASRSSSNWRSRSRPSPRLLLLDEPMAGLGTAESAQMIDLLRALKGEVTILLVEHDMDAVFALADRVSVLVDGQCIATGTSDAVRSDAAVRVAYLGEGDAVMLEVEGLQASYGRSRVLFDISLSVGEGEVVTLLGRNGMGKTTTIRSIMGLMPPLAGAITLRGRCDRRADAGERSPARGIGLVPEGRQVFPTAHRRGKPGRDRRQSARPRRTLDAARGSISCSRGWQERRRANGPHAVGRRAADAGDRPRADDQSAPADPRRGDRGAGAAAARRDLELPVDC